MPEHVKFSFDFGKIGALGTNFSGDYYLVVKPHDEGLCGVKVSTFKVFDNADDEHMNEYIQDKIEMFHTVINSESIQSYDHGETENMSIKGIIQQNNPN